MRRTHWGDRVTVIDTDMREWDTDERADILVSELLGSFGGKLSTIAIFVPGKVYVAVDNELSPECLDGAQRILNGTLATLHASASLRRDNRRFST